MALTSVTQLVERHPTRQKVSSLIPGQGTYAWVNGSVLAGACARGSQWMFLSHTNVSLPLSPSLPLSLKINK